VQESRSGNFWAIGRSAILITIGNAQAKAGLLQEAGATFEQARRIAWSIKDESPRLWENIPFAGPVVMCVDALSDVAIAQAKVGLSHEETVTFDQAHLVALSIKSDVDRADAFIRLARAQAKAALMKAGATYNEALQAVRFIEKEDWRASMFGSIAAAQADAGLAVEASSTLDQAMAAAPSIKDERQRAKLLNIIVSTLIKLGHFDQALTVAQSIEPENSRMEALDHLAKAHIEAGHFADALQVAPAIEDEHWRSLIVGAVAAAQAKAHQFSDALATAASIRGEYSSASALASVAVEQARVGLTRETVLTIDQAVHVAGTIQIDVWRADALRSIVKQLCSIAEALHE
jgi:tetratricopeptide (TPR) repeat protein